jgi:uncharacterized MAPEG superfamily protein
LSVADNARDADFLHVSASSERQECVNKTGLKNRSKHEILQFHEVYVSFCNVVIFVDNLGTLSHFHHILCPTVIF